MRTRCNQLGLLLALLFAALLGSAQCQSSHGGGAAAANLTVVGTVFCDACSTSSFSKNSYFLPGVRVRLDCMIKVNSNSKEEIKITAEKVTNSDGAYQLDIPAIDGFECAAPGATAGESFCRAAVLDNPSALCGVPAVTTTVGHISLPSQDPSACFYSLNSLYYRPSKPGPAQCGAEHVPVLLPAVAVAAHPVLHAAAVVPAHTVLHPAAAGVPVPAATATVLHPAVASATGVPFPAATTAMDDATVASAVAIVPVSSSAADLYNTIASATATAAATIPVPYATASTPASSPALPTATVTLLTATSSTSTTASAAVVPVDVSAVTVFPSWSWFFWAISSTVDQWLS
uniref:Pollen Ole e 1 allergen and extensin family protein n=1 Tax=Zea mays TaxID=4577 RepID=C0PAV0_MAIZE|nr:unknown [Zea mays]